jgi:glycosyltransferase involved in cell wall biosynthesis
MKVLHVSVSDLEGGAARAAYRLMQAQRTMGVDARLLVQDQRSSHPAVSGPTALTQRIMARARPILDQYPVRRYRNKGKGLFSPAWFPFSTVADTLQASDADVVHLHWINAGMLRPEDLRKVRKPMVWSMHDMWPFTGGCHYDEECGRWAQGCGSCPVLGSSNPGDSSRKVFLRKRKAYAELRQRTVVVGLSSWMAGLAARSALFDGFRVECLHNPIDTEVWKPVDTAVARNLMGLPQDAPILIFGAMGGGSDPRKGFDLLLAALQRLKDRVPALQLVVFGQEDPGGSAQLGFPMHYTGHLHDDLSLRIAYAAADAVVVPSRQEAFGQTASEAHACGTPAVAFDNSGVTDIIVHQRTGYLAKAFDVDDLAQGMHWVLEPGRRQELRTNARAHAERMFGYGPVAKGYTELYTALLVNGPHEASAPTG